MEEVVIRQEPAGAEAPKAEPANGRPVNLPDKFWDDKSNSVRTDALLGSYLELEKKQGQSKAAETPPSGQTDAQPQVNEQIKEELAEHKIDFDALTQEFSNNGSLKPESYAALEKAGIPKFVVDDYISGQAQRAEAMNNEIFESIGGKETFDAMINWAKSSMTEADIKAYNTAVDSGSAEQAKLAVAGLHAKYIKSNGGTPNLVGGTPASGATGYRSHAEQQRDMQDPRYRTDPAFREDVTRRSLASNF